MTLPFSAQNSQPKILAYLRPSVVSEPALSPSTLLLRINSAEGNHERTFHTVWRSCGSGDVGPRFSERILKRRVDEVAGLMRPALVDESAREKIAVARIALQMAREVVGGEEIGFRADVAGSGSVCRTNDGRGLVVDRIANGGSPEEILL